MYSNKYLTTQIKVWIFFGIFYYQITKTNVITIINLLVFCVLYM